MHAGRWAATLQTLRALCCCRRFGAMSEKLRVVNDARRVGSFRNGRNVMCVFVFKKLSLYVGSKMRVSLI